MAKVRKVPRKYTTGLKKSTAAKRKAAIRKRATGKTTKKQTFSPLPGDKKAKTRPSKYTQSATAIRKRISETSKKIKSDSPKTKFIRSVAKETGIPSAIIRQVYERGSAAWGTGGHRPGATQASWSKARVYSFIQKGKTAVTADADLYLKAKKQQRKSADYKLKR